MEEVSKEKALRKQEVKEQTLVFASALFSVTYRLLLQCEMLHVKETGYSLYGHLKKV